jgi:hypothetical protein
MTTTTTLLDTTITSPSVNSITVSTPVDVLASAPGAGVVRVKLADATTPTGTPWAHPGADIWVDTAPAAEGPWKTTATLGNSEIQRAPQLGGDESGRGFVSEAVGGVDHRVFAVPVLVDRFLRVRVRAFPNSAPVIGQTPPGLKILVTLDHETPPVTPRYGKATLVEGVATVASAAIAADSVVVCGRATAGGVIATTVMYRAAPADITPGVGFVIKAVADDDTTNTGDTSDVFWTFAA